METERWSGLWEIHTETMATITMEMDAVLRALLKLAGSALEVAQPQLVNAKTNAEMARRFMEELLIEMMVISAMEMDEVPPV